MVASHTWMKTVFEGTLKMRETVFYGLSPMHGDGSTKKWRTWEFFQIFSTLWFLRGEKNIYIFNKFNQTDLWYGLETEELLNYLVSHTDKCSLSVTSTAVWFIWYPRGMVSPHRTNVLEAWMHVRSNSQTCLCYWSLSQALLRNMLPLDTCAMNIYLNH